MKVYKVAVRRHGRLYSAVMDTQSVLVRYIPGVKAVPKVPGAKLFAFTKLLDAREFRACNRSSDPSEIWECEAEGVKKPKRSLGVYFGDWAYGCVKNAWATPCRLRDGGGWATAPKGTVWCDSIKPIEKVA